MTSEDDFQSQLDREPGDWQTRLVFADWLQERACDVSCPECKGKGEIRGDGIFQAGKPCLTCGGKSLSAHSHRKGTGLIRDKRAEGYRALGSLRRVPVSTNFSFPGYCRPREEKDRAYLDRNLEALRLAILPDDWLAEIDRANNIFDLDTQGWYCRPTRRQVEDDAALAFAKLPPNRRAELLAGA